MKTTRLRSLLLAGALLLPTLAGCSRKEPDAPAAEGEANDEAPAPVAAPVLPEPEPQPAPAPTAAPVDNTPAEAAVAPDEQMMDDATATGMTARAERGEEQPANTDTVAEPTDTVEQK